MRQLLCVGLVTVLAFVAGLVAGRWVERHRPVPPPPGSLGSEFAGHHPPMFGGYHHSTPPDRAELLRQVEALRPQIEAFRSKMEKIDADFSREFDLVLNPEQRTRHEESLKRMHDFQAKLSRRQAAVRRSPALHFDRTVDPHHPVGCRRPFAARLVDPDLQARRCPARESAGFARRPEAEGHRSDRLFAAAQRDAQPPRPLGGADGAPGRSPSSQAGARARAITRRGLTAADPVL